MITILLEKIKALLTELKGNIENINTSIDFSTDEKIIGKWIDNRPLYSKVIIIDHDMSVGSSWVGTGFKIPYMDSIRMGFINRIGGYSVEAMSIGVINVGENSEVAISTPYYTYPIGTGSNIIIFYTKSTDLEEANT